MQRTIWLFAMILASCGALQAQWDLEDSHTTADLRGIDNVGGGVAWASGTNGTVLRTEDGGYLWQTCAVPPGAEHLDFRGIQAFDANTAIVMSSGKGDLSRLYKTTDGCHTWKLVFTNPDDGGFFDAVYKAWDGKVYVIGDPVQGVFAMFFSEDLGENWYGAGETGRDAHPGDAVFAASNSSLTGTESNLLFGTGSSAANVYSTGAKCSPPSNNPNGPAVFNCTIGWGSAGTPIVSGSPSSGIFSLATRPFTAKNGVQTAIVVAVGGDYTKSDQSTLAVGLVCRWRYALDRILHPAPRLPLRRSLRRRHQNLDHRGPERHRHLHRRRPQLARPPSRPRLARAARRRPQLECALTTVRRRPPRPHRQAEAERAGEDIALIACGVWRAALQPVKRPALLQNRSGMLLNAIRVGAAL